MTNETQQASTPEVKLPAFGERLRTAREAMGLERKDAAAQLRLNEKLIIMMEKDRYPVDLPVTFIRGYIRAYGKLLQIPEYEIRKGIEPIKPPEAPAPIAAPAIKPAPPVTSGNYFMQFFTYLIVLTLFGLVGTWWYTHQPLPTTLAEATKSAAGTPGIPTETTNESPIPATELPLTASAPGSDLPDTIIPNQATSALPDTIPQQPAKPKVASPIKREPANMPMQPSIMQPPQANNHTQDNTHQTVAANTRTNYLDTAAPDADEPEPDSEYAE